MRTYTIVIVENDEDEQFFMKDGFDAAGGFEILAQVRNGDALFEWLEQNRDRLPDLILSDLNMPGKNGYDIITGTKQHSLYTNIPVVITSTSSTRTIMDKCLTLGAADYLVKPETWVDYGPFVNNLHKLIEDKNLVN